MEFCTECGSRLVPKKVNSGTQTLIMLACTKCQFKKQESDRKTQVTGKIFEHNPKQFVAVIGKEEQLTVLPTLQTDCPRCGNTTANVWQVQTRIRRTSTQISDTSNAATPTNT